MHYQGHVGAMMLAYSPFAFLFIVLGHYGFAALGFALLLAMPMIPDIDMKLKNFTPIKHRGFTHTVWFGLLLGFINLAVVIGAGYYYQELHSFLDITQTALFAFFIGNMWVDGHLVGDAITIMGVKPFEPVSSKKIRIEFSLFRLPTRASSAVANFLMLALGAASVSLGTILGYYIQNGMTLQFVV